jgi:hypothetical protein
LLVVFGVVEPAFIPVVVGILAQQRPDNGMRPCRRYWLWMLRMDVGKILLLPGCGIRAREGTGVIDADRNLDVTAWSNIKSQPRERLTLLSQNEHDGPIRATKDAAERLLVRETRTRTVARMRVDPDAGELLGPTVVINLSVEEVSHRLVVEGHVCPGSFLLDQPHVFDKQQILTRCNAETANFRVPIVTQEQQFRPRRRAQPKRRPALDRAESAWLRLRSLLLVHGNSRTFLRR